MKESNQIPREYDRIRENLENLKESERIQEISKIIWENLGESETVRKENSKEYEMKPKEYEGIWENAIKFWKEWREFGRIRINPSEYGKIQPTSRNH